MKVCLRQANRPPQFRARLETIITTICAMRRLDLDQIKTASRSHYAAETRALIAYFAVERGAASLSRLARLFNRDLATLSNAVNRIRKRIKSEPGLAVEVGELANILGMDRKIKAWPRHLSDPDNWFL